MEVPTYEFLKDAADAANAAAVAGDPLVGSVVQDTVYEDITDLSHGVRIGDCDSDCAPVDEAESADGMEEFDARLTVIVFARVLGDSPADRAAARLKAKRLWLRIARLFWNDTTMDGRVRDVLLRRASRGFDQEGGSLFAVVNMPLLVNGTGQLLEDER